MTPSAYLKKLSQSEREDLAKRCGTTLGQMNHLAYGRKCGTALAVALERETNGAVTRKESRRDWKRHWPELAA